MIELPFARPCGVAALALVTLVTLLTITGCTPAAVPQAALASPVIVDAPPSGAAIVFRPTDLDPAAPPCSDFNAHVNGRWLAANPVPADRTVWGVFPALRERSLAVQHTLARQAAAASAPTGSIRQQVGDFFAAGMDEAAIAAAGMTPVQPLLAAIAAIDDRPALIAHLSARYAAGRGLPFSLSVSADIRDSSLNIAYLGQGGLSLPDRSYYLDDEAEAARIRSAFQAHVSALFALAGTDEVTAARHARQVLAFETRLARASLDRVALRDPVNRYNPVDIATANTITPGFNWAAFFTALDVIPPASFSLAPPRYFEEFAAMLQDVAVEHWKAWLAFKTLDGAAPHLEPAFEQQSFLFYRQTLAGQQQPEARWKRQLGTLNGSLGEALGQLYVEATFPPSAKAEMTVLVDNLRLALRARLENLPWMSETTRAQALQKWSTFTAKIGHPDTWRDWSALQITRDSHFANVTAAAAYNARYRLARIGQPVDPGEWGMSPQTVNAYYRATANEIVFPAAILQPPFFDPAADDALNYGGIGAVIGHEMLHGYDDQGSKFDASGNLENWWTDADRAGFEARAAGLVAQFDRYEPLPGQFINGRLSLGENIADLGGLTVAFDALLLAQARDQAGGDPRRPHFSDPMIDGLSQSQRFFINWATLWRTAYTEQQLALQLRVGPHAPGMFRAMAAPANMSAFAEAFACQPGDPMARQGADRVVIW